MSFNIMNNIDYYDNNKVPGNPLIAICYGRGSGSYKVGIYIRLSKEDEEKEKYSESESIQNQRALLMQYIKENKLNFIAEYVDDGISGTSFDRPGFNKMIEDIENGKINMVITKDLSRLGRNYVQSGYYTETYFPEHNVRYIAILDNIDTAIDSANNDIAPFKSILNEMYAKDTSKKINSVLQSKRNLGEYLGTAPYGYKKSEEDKHKLEIDEESASVVRRIFDMFISGDSLSKICDTLTNEHIKTPSMHKNMKLGQDNVHYGIWATRTVNDILKNPTYIGNLTQCRQRKVNYKSKKRVHNKESDWVISEGAVPPIIDKETFELAIEMFKSNKNRGKGNGVTDKLLLRGLIYCKDCKHTIGFREHLQETQKYGLVKRIYGNCNYWAKRKKQDVCTPHSVKYQIIEDIVLDSLREMAKKYLDENNLESILKNSDKLKKKKDSIKVEIFRLEQTIESTNRKIDVCYNDKLEGNITLEMYKRTYNNLTLEINELKRKKQEYEKVLYNLENNQEIDDNYYLDKIKEFLEMKNPSRALISSLIDRIEIDEEKNIDIYYKFKLI